MLTKINDEFYIDLDNVSSVHVVSESAGVTIRFKNTETGLSFTGYKRVNDFIKQLKKHVSSRKMNDPERKRNTSKTQE